MYRAMIVEDEVFVRLGLKSIIPWETLGLSLCADAANGAEGYQLYVDLKPDIILTDLRMPVMGGIEMIRRIRRGDRRVRFIILTCLDEFAPVKEALELGASAYVLKHSSDVEEIVAKLEIAREELLREDGRAEDPQRLAGRRAEALCRLLQSFPDGAAAEALPPLSLRLKAAQLNVAVFRLSAGVEAAGPAGALADALGAHFARGGSGEACVVPPGQEVVAAFNGGAAQRDEVLALGMDRLDALGVRGFRVGMGAPVDGFETLGEAYQEALSLLAPDGRTPILHPKVRAAVDYLEKNHAQPLSLQDVAGALGITPGYLSRLFGLSGGRGFVETLNDIRIAHARGLLRKTSLPVHVVGRRVGFPNATYFIRVFRKAAGLTPNEYRAAAQEGQ